MCGAMSARFLAVVLYFRTEVAEATIGTWPLAYAAR